MEFIEKLKWSYDVKTNWVQTILRVFLGACLLFAGIAHLTIARQEFVAQVPTWLPLSTDLVVIVSGFVEIALGASLIFIPKWKALVGWLAALFFVLIFPGNISQYVNHIDAFGMHTDFDRLKRLFFQPVLVAWALWSTAAFKAYINRNKK